MGWVGVELVGQDEIRHTSNLQNRQYQERTAQ